MNQYRFCFTFSNRCYHYHSASRGITLGTISGTTCTDTDSKGQAITVVRGDTVSELVLKVYGNYSALALDLIKEFNPTIADLDRILVGQRLILPSLSRETLLRKQEDGEYRLILGTFSEKLKQRKQRKQHVAKAILPPSSNVA